MAKGKFGAGQMWTIVLFVAIGLYMFSNFAEFKICTQAHVDAENQHGCEVVGDKYFDFVLPTDAAGDPDVDNVSFTMIKLGIIGLLVFAGYALVSKWRGVGMSRRDVMALILLGVAAYFMWPLLAGAFNAASLDDIGLAVGQKLGFFG